ncbi:hypothetical protein AYL99_02126 [Fonsecaea erecta]|uniref:Uncharacterized protein n=1 Tax=Fonsecaea erecta TaxID=1367422 RepID=A0A178ZSW2_9EURO|nr:hypothetical protein AYL99_02126 [Fonsecaea erecta]OAP62899.1 hypothetical protein AYL99_02126 [Fonsecaea erecta]
MADDDENIDRDFLPGGLPQHELCDWFLQNNHAGFEAALYKRQNEILWLARLRHGLAFASVPLDSNNAVPLIELVVIKDMLAYAQEIQHLLEIAQLFQIRIAVHNEISHAQAALRPDFRRSLSMAVAHAAHLFSQNILDAQIQATINLPAPPPGPPLKFCDSPSCNAIFLAGIPGHAVLYPGAWVVSCQTPHHETIDANRVVAWAWLAVSRGWILGPVRSS